MDSSLGHAAAQGGQPIVAAAVVVQRRIEPFAGPLVQLGGGQALDGAVERARPIWIWSSAEAPTTRVIA